MKSITKGISKGTIALLLLLCSCLFATPSHALDPDKRGSHEVWSRGRSCNLLDNTFSK